MKSLIFVTVLINIINTCFAYNFSVLVNPTSYGGSGVNVVVDGVSYPMTSKNNDILYEYSYREGIPNRYHYEIAGTEDSELVTFGYEREWEVNMTSTLYEVYGRRYTTGDKLIKPIPRLYPPHAGYKKFSLLFQEGEIPVINVHMNETDYETLISMTEDHKYRFSVNFDLYTPYKKYVYTNTTLQLSGQGSKENEKKPYKFKLEKSNDKNNSKLLGIEEFKLRSLRFDESGIKNKLANDISDSLGIPYAQTSFCRLYINNRPYGFYELSDMYKKKFLRRFFNVQKINNENVYGALYKGHYKSGIPAYLDSNFQDMPVENLYEVIVPETTFTNTTDNTAEILNVISWLEQLPETATKADIESKFEIDIFLKYALIEYLVCHWDGYLSRGNNYFMYIEPNNGKYHFFSYDFDLTMGKWCHAVEGSIDDYINTVNDEDEKPAGEPLLYKKILNHPEIRPIFDKLAIEVVTNLFNVEALTPRIDYFHEFLRDDLYWDTSCYEFIETQAFADASDQPIPTKEVIDEQFTNVEKTKYLKGYIKAKSESVLSSYNATAQFKAEGKYGLVGNKLLQEEEKKENNANAQPEVVVYSDSTGNKPATILIFTLLTILLAYIL